MFSVSSFNHQCSPCFTASSFKYIFDVFKVCIKLLIDSWFQFLSLYLNLLTREEDEANMVESDIAEQFLERSSPSLSLFLMIDWLRFLVTLYNTTPGFWMVEGPKTPLSCRTGSLIRWDPVNSQEPFNKKELERHSALLQVWRAADIKTASLLAKGNFISLCRHSSSL